MPTAFHPFTPEHYAALAAGTVAGIALIAAGRRGGRGERTATRVLAITNLAVYPLSTAAWLATDTPRVVENLVPLHLCDLAAIAAGLALLTRRPLLCALTYFWGLAATLQGLLTPAIGIGFPSAPFLMFFIQHFAVVIAALYLPLALGWRPKTPWWRGPLEVFGVSVGYLVSVMAINRILGSNFAFVSHPPENPSLIDHLGPWPWYIGSLSALALVMFLLLGLPFAGKRRPDC